MKSASLRASDSLSDMFAENACCDAVKSLSSGQCQASRFSQVTLPPLSRALPHGIEQRLTTIAGDKPLPTASVINTSLYHKPRDESRARPGLGQITLLPVPDEFLLAEGRERRSDVEGCLGRVGYTAK